MNEDPTTMERLRADLIRRARVERHGEIDVQQIPIHISGPRRPFLRLFRRGNPPASAHDGYHIDIESPKSPEADEESAPHRGFRFPRPWTARSNDPRAQPESQPEMGQINRPVTAPSSVATTSSGSHRVPRSRRTENSSDESQVTGDTGVSRHRRRLSGDARRSRRRHQCSRHPKRFLFCLPWVKSSRARKQIILCFVSGLILLLLVTVYLCLSMTNKVRTSEMTIMLILVILFATIFFFHGLIRLCITLVRGSRESANGTRLPRYGPRGYAVPPHPIPVVLTQDEEAVGVQSEATKSKPPAYGLWRESVRVDPNRLFWQRNETADQAQPRPSTRVGPRPPSYASDDGVSYVVEATPRSTVPGTDVPLPVHPSEIGRVAQFPRP